MWAYYWLGFVVGAASMLGIIKFDDWRRMPYRWKCPKPKCSVSMKAGSKEYLEIGKNSHKHD